MREITDYIFSPGGDTPSGADANYDATEDLVKSGASDPNAFPKAWFTDPFALLDSLGLGYKAHPSGLSYETLKQMAENNSIVAAIHQTRIHQVSSFIRPQPNKYSTGFRIRHRYDPDRRLSEGERNLVRELEHFMLRCGEDWNPDRDDLEQCTKKLVRDTLTYDQMCTEVVPKYSGKPHSFYAVPANTIRLAQPKHKKGTPLRGRENREDVKYIQVIDGIIVNTFSREEMGFTIRNPRTDIRAWGYGYAELEMLVRTVTAHLWAEEWNRKQFSQGSTTKGILNIKGNVPPQQMDAFKRQWLTQVSGVTNAWRTPIINSNEDLQWISFQPTNQEMGYKEWMDYLIKIAAAIYLIDPAEINFDMRMSMRSNPQFMGTNEAQQKISQDRGLRPLLRCIQNHYNRNIVWRIAPEFEFEFVGIDAKSEDQAIDLRLKELNAYKTLNEVREADQLPPVPHGDIVPNPTYIGYVNQQNMMQQQQQQMGGMGGGGMPGASEGAVPGFAGAEKQQPRGEAEDHVKERVEDELNGGNKKKQGEVVRLADRYVAPVEEWETTYNAGIVEVDLLKALEPFNDLIDD